MSIDFSFEKAKPFKFSAVAKQLEQSLSRINGVMGASSSQTRVFILVAKGKKLGLIGFSQDTFCAMVVPNAVPESDGALSFTPADLQGVIKGRAEMDFDFTGGDLHFKLAKGKYSGNIKTMPIPPEQMAIIASTFATREKKGGSNALSRDMLNILKEGMALTSVKDVYTQQEMISYIVFTEKEIRISAFDQHHFALYRKQLKSGSMDFRVALPISHFRVIDKMVEDSEEDAQFILRPEAIRVEGKTFLLSLPATQGEANNFDMVRSFLKTTGDMPYQLQYKHEHLQTTVDNLFTLNAVNTNFQIALKKDALTFTFSTQRGSASDSLKIKRIKGKDDEVKVNIDPALLRDLIGLIKGQKDTAICIKKGSILTLTSKTPGTGASLTLASALVKGK